METFQQRKAELNVLLRNNEISFLDYIRALERFLINQENKGLNISHRVMEYMRAIETDSTDRYWDYKDVLNGKMTQHDFVKKWHNQGK